MFDRVRRSKKRPPSDFPLWEPKIEENVLRPLAEKWPAWRDGVKSAAQAVGQKLGDAYAAAAQAVTERKEAWQDSLAEKKNARTATGRRSRKKPSA